MTRIEEIDQQIDALQREKVKLIYPNSRKEVYDMFDHHIDFTEDECSPVEQSSTAQKVTTIDQQLHKTMHDVYFTKTYLQSVYDRIRFMFVGGKNPWAELSECEEIPHYEGMSQALSYIESQFDNISDLKQSINEYWHQHIDFNGK